MTQNEIMMMGMENIHLKDVFKTSSLFGKKIDLPAPPPELHPGLYGSGE